MATKSDTNYRNRAQPRTSLGLANTVVFHTFNLTYARQINDNLSVTGQVGLVGVSNEFSLALPKTMLPIYSIEGSWSITPKLTTCGLRLTGGHAPDDGYRQRRGGL